MEKGSKSCEEQVSDLFPFTESENVPPARMIH